MSFESKRIQPKSDMEAPFKSATAADFEVTTPGLSGLLELEQPVPSSLTIFPAEEDPHPRARRLSAQEIAIDTQLAPKRLGQGERGVLLSPSLVHPLDNGWIAQHRFDHRDLMFSLLFFDRIECPRNNIIDTQDPLLTFLISQGVVQRSFSEVILSAPQPMDACLAIAAKDVFNQLTSTEGDSWSIGRDVRSLELFDDQELHLGAAIDFGTIFPVPDADANIEDVLEFKFKRSAELARLRNHIDNVMDDAQSGTLKERAASCMAELAQGIEDYARLCREARIPVRLANIKTKLNYKTVSGAMAGGAFAFSMALPPSLQTLSGVMGAIGFSLEAELVPKLRPRRSPYEYVVRYQKEALWRH